MGILSKLFGSSNVTTEADMAAIINNSETLLIDVRTPDEFKAGSVKGAVNIPLDTILQNINKLKQHSHVVVFCRSGNRSARAKQLLQRQGIKKVINGGTWQQVAQYK